MDAEDDILSEILGESLDGSPQLLSISGPTGSPEPTAPGIEDTDQGGSCEPRPGPAQADPPAPQRGQPNNGGPQVAKERDGAAIATTAVEPVETGQGGGTQPKSPNRPASETQTPQAAAKDEAQATAKLPEKRAEPRPGVWAQTPENKIKGALFGAALGDALGLQADGLQPAEVAERYPRGLKFPANVRIQGNQANDWSGLSDQMILALRTLREWYDRLTGEPEHALAQKLAHWAKYGMTDLGDAAGPAVERLTREVTKDPNFLLQPREVAKKIQQLHAAGSRSNPGAILRAIPAAFVPENPLRWAGLLTQVTHADMKDELAARCAVRFVWAAASLEGMPLAAETVIRQLDQLLAEAQKLGLKDFEETALPLFIDSRELGFLSGAAPNAPGARIGADLGGDAVYRTLACGLWVLRAFIRGEPRTPEFVKEHLAACAAKGGAACANTGLVGALLGAAVGYTGLPADWLKALPFHDALARETDLFLKATEPPAKNSGTK